jgi:fibrillarin-like pre-rRNA processing protein
MELLPFYLPNVCTSDDKKKLYTLNLNPGMKVYNEDLITIEGIEYRYWNPFRSKLAALLLKKSKSMDFVTDNKILYLGAASGTTVSHLSDIITKGRIYCVENSERPFRDLVRLCERRFNLIPILGNGRKPEDYRAIVEVVDWVYQDISQRDQVDIFIKNTKMYMKKSGRAVIMVKSRSIDVNIQPDEIYKDVQTKLKNEGFKIIEMKILSPFQKDHAAFILKLS